MKFRWGYLGLMGLTLAYGLQRFHSGWQAAPVSAIDPPYQLYGRVEHWIKSSLCSQKTGTFLVGCGNSGEYFPIEDLSLAEDRGHCLIANLWAPHISVPFSATHLVQMNIAINAISVLALTGMLLFLGFPWIAWWGLFVGIYYAVPGPIPGPDAPSSFLGVFLLSFIPILWTGIWITQEFSTRKRLCGHAFSTAILVITRLLRESMAFSSIVIMLVLSIWRLLRKGDGSAKQDFFITLLGCVLAYWSPPMVLGLRNQLWPVAPAHLVTSHGLAHNLYIGLGAESNPWGISYHDDVYGLMAARKVKPDVIYCSPEYFRILFNLYTETLRNYPAEVARIYWSKTVKVFFFPLLWLKVPLWVYFTFSLLGCLCAWRYAKRTAPDILRMIFGINAAIIFLQLQGVLTKPAFLFLHPLKLGILLLIACWVQWGVTFLADKRRNDHG